MATKNPSKVLAAAGGSVDDAFDGDHEAAYREVMKRIPSDFHKHVDEAISHGMSFHQKIFAAAAAAILVREEMQPNSAFTMYPSGLARSANAVLNTVYPLVPYKAGVAQPQFNFVAGQRFFGIMTGKTDTVAGWQIAAGTLLFSVDAISGINQGDASFALFEEDVVLGRMITGEYTRHTILESIPFSCSAVLTGPIAAPMTEGVTIQYWDERCKNERLISRAFDVTGIESFSDLVRDLQEMAGAGAPAMSLVKRIRRHRRGL